jgi:hypothetical protein
LVDGDPAGDRQQQCLRPDPFAARQWFPRMVELDNPAEIAVALERYGPERSAQIFGLAERLRDSVERATSMSLDEVSELVAGFV